jgi:hypothetical protein
VGHLWTTFFNIQSIRANLKFRAKTIFKSCTEKLQFSIVANILIISVRGFFAHLILCPKVPRKKIDGALMDTPVVANKKVLFSY